MSTQVTLTEAATFLGISKATLRNWDKDGKLSAIRNPVNRYRLYDLDTLITLKQTLSNSDSIPTLPKNTMSHSSNKDVKKTINTLATILRDSDSDSNIITRFDEISKLLLLKLVAEKNEHDIFAQELFETKEAYFERISTLYQKTTEDAGIDIPSQFQRLKLSPDALLKCGHELSRVNLSHANCDMKGVAYEDTIRGTFDKNDNQQFFTPYQIVDFMVQLLTNHLHGTICDPACGTGGFLTKIPNTGAKQTLLGFEVDERLAWISNLNLLIHGMKCFNIAALPSGGSLGEKANSFFNTVDVILTNPPFGSDYTDRALLDTFTLGRNKPSRRRGILFIEQAWNLLKENGLLGIIIDQSVLNATTNYDVRKFILTHYKIKAIIELPETAFMPYANVNSSIMILEKVLKEIPQKSIFYAKSEKIGRKNNGDDDYIYSCSQAPKLDSDLNDIVDKWEQYLAGNFINEEKYFIADFDCSRLENPALRIDYAYHHPFREKSKKLLEKSAYELKTLAELCEERNHSFIPSSDEGTPVILYTGLANIESFSGRAIQVPTPAASIKSSVKRYEPGDIIFAKMRPSLRKISVMDFDKGGFVSSECSVLTVRKNTDGEEIINPYLLSALLRSDFVFGQIMSYVTGIGRPRISQQMLRKILIPYPPQSIQTMVLLSLNSTMDSVRQLREKASLLNAEADTMENNILNKVANSLLGGTL